jgi:hypothetical protein
MRQVFIQLAVLDVLPERREMQHAEFYFAPA